MDKLTNLLNRHSFFPIMGEKLTLQNTIMFDFSANNPDLNGIQWKDTLVFNDFVFDQVKTARKSYGAGGYLEDRVLYQRSNVFGEIAKGYRNIHLGMDIWTEEGKEIFAPLDGFVHSFQDNQGFGNYGPTILLEHQLEGTVFYTLYGHLQRKDLEGLDLGQSIAQGEKFCHVGPFPENGDWPPHLHFQIIADLWGNVGDFPGVCAGKDVDKYRANCPDPNLIVQIG